MEDVFDIVWVVAVIIAGIFKLMKSANKPKSDEDTSDGEEIQAEESQLQAEQDESAPVFAYFYTRNGEKRIDVGQSNRLSGRELTEYEIFTEKKRLDALWAAELERREAAVEAEREEIYEAEPAPEAVPVSEILKSVRREKAEETVAVSVSSSDEDYQLQQLERWLEAGLIDKDEYRRRKRELK